MTLDFFYFVVSEAVTEKEPQCNYYFLQVKGEPPNLNLIFNSQALLEQLYMNQVKNNPYYFILGSLSSSSVWNKLF